MLERFMHRVETLYLDRHTVTNLEYQQFVDAGGYEKLEYWHEERLTRRPGFRRPERAPGPRYWIEGRYAGGDERQPVVGVSWYEAAAYACWAGKRLPSDAEWTKAGAWPVEVSAGPHRPASLPVGRVVRHPPGESVGASHKKGPVGVDEFSDGESVGGVHQLVGNVWEWTGSALISSVEPSLHVPETFKSVLRRGVRHVLRESCHLPLSERRARSRDGTTSASGWRHRWRRSKWPKRTKRREMERSGRRSGPRRWKRSLRRRFKDR